MSELFRNPVPLWLKSGAIVSHEGKYLRLGTCLEGDDLDESDVAAAVLFHRWKTPQGFRDAVMNERDKRLAERDDRVELISTIDEEDLTALRSFAADACENGNLTEVTLTIRDHSGSKRICSMTLDALLSRIREYRTKAKETRK